MKPANMSHTRYWKSATPAQIRLMERACRGMNIVDLGGRDGSLARHLLEAGARCATSVDHQTAVPRLRAARLHSWPITYANQLDAVIPALKRCRRIIYLGRNDRLSQCGTCALWRYLIHRQLMKCLKRKCSTILIYGEADRDKPLSEEERWGLKAINR
jgi:hypothetical protein